MSSSASAAEIQASAAGETLLAEGTSFEGMVVLPHAARIDGHIRGEIVAHGSLCIGPSGTVEGDLVVSSVRVEGRLRGDLRATVSIALGPAARVDGDLSAPRLSIAEGAQVNGRCRCGVDTARPATKGPSAP